VSKLEQAKGGTFFETRCLYYDNSSGRSAISR